MIEDVEPFKYDYYSHGLEKKYKNRGVIQVGYDYVIRDVGMVANESVSL